MADYSSNRLFKVGKWLLIIGAVPLCAIIVLAQLGLWPDPDPNPVGAGLLFFVSLWPAVICMGIGAFQVWRRSE